MPGKIPNFPKVQLIFGIRAPKSVKNSIMNLKTTRPKAKNHKELRKNLQGANLKAPRSQSTEYWLHGANPNGSMEPGSTEPIEYK